MHAAMLGWKERVGMFTHELTISATLYPNPFWFFYINSHYE